MENKRIILHVDDDPDQRRIVSALLEHHGYVVESASDAEEATSKLAETSIRVVLLDIDMPGKDGLTLLKEIKQWDGGMQVIMLTGLERMSTILQSMRWGAEACIFKPLTDPTQLLEAIEAAFAKIDRWWVAVHEVAKQKDQLRKTQPAASPVEKRTVAARGE